MCCKRVDCVQQSDGLSLDTAERERGESCRASQNTKFFSRVCCVIESKCPLVIGKIGDNAEIHGLPGKKESMIRDAAQRASLHLANGIKGADVVVELVLGLFRHGLACRASI